MMDDARPTLGSLFAGIGGFDLGFEWAGFRTAWQVEINSIHQQVLRAHFPHAKLFSDVRACGSRNLAPVDVLTAGFPCQDISVMGASRKDKTQPNGLAGSRSGLFQEVIRIAREIQPAWLVLENVPNLLAINDSRDLQTVLQALADSGYVGFWRVLDAQYFGVPQGRRRLFVVAGLGRYPPLELLADASPVESIPRSAWAQQQLCLADGYPAYTLLATNTRARISLGCENLICHAGRRDAMVERARTSQANGIPLGLDDYHWYSSFAAGNAVSPLIAEWIGRHLLRGIAA